MKFGLFLQAHLDHHMIFKSIHCCRTTYQREQQKHKIILAGDEPLNEMVNEFVQKKGGNYHLLGKLKPTSLVDLYKQCAIGLSAYTEKSNVEMPDKFYDYTAAGLPIINSLKGEVGKIIKNENIGINYNPDNNYELYDAIIRLSKNTSLSKLMATNFL